MRKIYVIGDMVSTLIEIRRALTIKEDIEITQVRSIEDIPLQERAKPDFTTEQIYEFTAPKIQPLIYFEDKKRKGYERPYKYHK